MIQLHFSGEGHGTLSRAQGIQSECRKIKVGDCGAKSLKKNVHILEVRMPWVLIVSVNNKPVGRGFGDTELLNHHAKCVQTTFGHLSASF